MKRGLIIGLLILGALMGALGMTLVIMGATESGTRLLADQLQRWLPLRLVGVAGTIGGRLAIAEVALDLPAGSVRIEKLTVDLGSFALLFDDRVVFHELGARRLTFTPAESAASPTTSGPLLLPELPLEIVLESVRVEAIEVPGIPVVSLAGRAAWIGDRVQVDDLSFRSTQFAVDVSAALAGGRSPALEARLTWSLPGTGWSGEGRFAGPLARLQMTHTVQGDFPFSLSGSMDLAELTNPALALAWQVDDVVFDRVSARSIVGQIAGKPDELVFSMTAQLAVAAGENEPLLIPVSALAKGAATGPIAFSLTAQPLGGSLALTGEARHEGAPQVDLKGRFDALPLAALLPEAAGAARTGFLSGDVALAFVEGAVDLELAGLAGALDDAPIKGSAQLHVTAGELSIPHLDVTVGDNQLRASGSLDTVGGEGLMARAQLDLRDLDDLMPGAIGAVSASLDLAGHWPVLTGELSLSGNEIAVGSVSVAALQGAATVTETSVSGSLTAAQLQVAGTVIHEPTLAVKGAPADLGWRFESAEGDATGRLRQAAGEVSLAVESLAFAAREQVVRIEAPFGITWDGELQAEPLCLVTSASDSTRACVTRLAWGADGLITSGHLDDLSPGQLVAMLPVDATLDGRLDGQWELQGAPGSWQGELALAATDLAVTLPEADAEPIPLADFNFDARVAGDTLSVDLAASDSASALSGEVRLTPLDPSGALTGRFDLAVPALADLTWLRALDERLVAVAGGLHAQVDLDGSLAAPRVSGQSKLTDGGFELQAPGFSLSAINLAVDIDPEGAFVLRGTARQGDAPVTVTGEGSGLLTGEPTLAVSLQAEALRLEQPDFSITAAPDLQLSLASGRARLTGAVVVPAADIRIRSLPASVPRPSTDVVVLGRQRAVAPVTGSGLDMDVRIRLGDNVRLSALAVQAGMTGEVRVTQDDRGRMSARGTLEVTGGVVSAEGQTLVIERGTVVYNGPVGNPYIDVRAVREIPDKTPPVRVGLHIRGNADRLESSIFSEPAMAENRALAFLVLGRDIDAGSESDEGALLAAAINFGLRGSKSLIGELQRATGLDELSATAAGSDRFSVVAGKRLGKDLYLRYTYDTLAAAGIFLISFDLTDHWRLEALSGEQSALDVLYRIER